jgi:hypothetical protein
VSYPDASTRPLSTSMRVRTPQMETAPTAGAPIACVLITTRPQQSTTGFARRCSLGAPTRWPVITSPSITRTTFRAASQAARLQTRPPPLKFLSFAATFLPAAGSSAARTTATTRLRSTTGKTPPATRSVSITRRAAPTPGLLTISWSRTRTTAAARSPSTGAPTLRRPTSTRPPPCSRVALQHIRAAPTASQRATSQTPIPTTPAACTTSTAAAMPTRSISTLLRP